MLTFFVICVILFGIWLLVKFGLDVLSFIFEFVISIFTGGNSNGSSGGGFGGGDSGGGGSEDGW